MTPPTMSRYAFQIHQILALHSHAVGITDDVIIYRTLLGVYTSCKCHWKYNKLTVFVLNFALVLKYKIDTMCFIHWYSLNHPHV